MRLVLERWVDRNPETKRPVIIPIKNMEDSAAAEAGEIPLLSIRNVAIHKLTAASVPL
ncbi:hypothetical protein D3C77_389060 [compost metagenome]